MPKLNGSETPAEPETPAEGTEGTPATPAEPAAPATETAAETPATEAATAPVAEGEIGHIANMSEAESIIKAERNRRMALETQVQTLTKNFSESQAALKLAKLSERIEGAVRTGRMTPAEAEGFTKNIVKMSEDSWPLDAVEARAENSAVPFSERGSGLEPPTGQSDAERADAAAHAYMSENKLPNSAVNYRKALLQVTGSGYRG